MKTKLLIIIIFLFVVSFSYAQIIQIQGELLDSTLKSPLPYSNVILNNKNDSLIAGVITNEKGEFTLKNISYEKGMYLLTKYIGYVDTRIDLFFNTETKINVGQIYLKQFEYHLNEVTIQNKINYIEQKFDRKVFSINENKIAAARSILDLLRTLPGVVVDDEGNVRYKGAEATFYVDDQLMKYIYHKIELIDVTMRTGGDGRGGIINIKLKSVNPDGLSGMLSSSISTIKFENIDKSKELININYKKKYFTFFVNSSFENTILDTYTTSEKDINSFEPPSVQNSNSEELYKWQPKYNYVGVIYRPSQNTKLYFSCAYLNAVSKSQFENALSEYNNTNQVLTNKYNNRDSSDAKQLNKGITLSYWHKIDTLDTYIKIVCNYTKFNGFSEKNSIFDYSTINSIKIDSINNYSNNRNFYSKTIYFNFLYNHSISRNARWNISYNLSIGLEDSSANKHYILNKLDLPKSQFANNFNQQHDLSFRIGTQIKKWKIDGGINLSDAFINGSYLRYNSEEDDTLILLNKNYFKILPSATIAFSLSDKAEIKLSLSKTTSMPYFRQLSDYIDKQYLYNWSSGNSELKPVDFYSIYLGYTFNKQNLNATAECFFNYTDNEVANVSIPLTSLLVLTEPENSSKISNTGIDLSVWYMVNSKLNFSLSSSIFHTYYNTNSLSKTAKYYNLPVGNYAKRQFGYTIKYNMEYKIKQIYAMFYVNYSAKELTFDGYDKALINSSFNVSRKFYNNKLRITIGLNTIFDDLVEHGSYSNNFGVTENTKITGSRYSRIYSFSIQYNFRQGDRGTKDYK